MTQLIICGLEKLERHCLEFDPDLVISISDPSFRSRLAPYLKHARQYFPLDFTDMDRISHAGTAPALRHFRDLKAMLDQQFPNGIEKLLVHCQMGISRSPATAIYTLAELATRSEAASPELAKEITDQVFAAAPDANPNMRIIQIAEHMIDGFDYSLISAVQDHLHGTPNKADVSIKRRNRLKNRKRLFRV